MKLLEEVQEILNKYYLGVDVPEEYNTVYSFIKYHPEKRIELFKHPIIDDEYLQNKYKNNIREGGYGFDIGSPTPINWFIVVDKILELLIKNDPDLVIQQIKIKFGGMDFFVISKKIDDIFDIYALIAEKLHSNKLIY